MRHIYRRPKRQKKQITQMNLTPIIDVMMVLLTVFMVTAPLLTSGIKLDLPNGGKSALNANEKSINISVDKNGNFYIAKTRLHKSALMQKLKQIKQTNHKTTITISADKKTDYGNVIELMGMIKDLGLEKVSLKTIYRD